MSISKDFCESHMGKTHTSHTFCVATQLDPDEVVGMERQNIDTEGVSGVIYPNTVL